MNLEEHLVYLKKLQEVKQPTTDRKVTMKKKVRNKNRLKKKTFRNKKP